MAWNPTPEVAECRRIAKKWNCEQAIIIGIDSEGQFTLATYGETAELCRCAKAFGDAAIHGIAERVHEAENHLSKTRGKQ